MCVTDEIQPVYLLNTSRLTYLCTAYHGLGVQNNYYAKFACSNAALETGYTD
jgi:hypothetical protein